MWILANISPTMIIGEICPVDNWAAYNAAVFVGGKYKIYEILYHPMKTYRLNLMQKYEMIAQVT